MTTARPTTEEATEALMEGTARRKDVFNLAVIQLVDELAKGEPVSRKRASELLGVPGEKIDKMFTAMEAGGGQLDDQGKFHWDGPNP